MEILAFVLKRSRELTEITEYFLLRIIAAVLHQALKALHLYSPVRKQRWDPETIISPHKDVLM